MQVIIVKYIDDIDGVVLVNDDEATDVLNAFETANKVAGGSLSFELHKVDPADDVLNFIRNP